MKPFAKIFSWIKKLFIKDVQPISIKMQIEQFQINLNLK